MLRELRIKNFAIIESVALPLAPGFNVLSGETGAGKSIIVGALGLLLGERGSADLIRTGTTRASVEGVFDAMEGGDVTTLLDDRGIEVEDGLVVLRRELTAGGKGRAWINDAAVSTAVLAEAGRLLVNLHGQHEAQTLLGSDAQRGVLDSFAGAHDAARLVRAAHATVTQLEGEIAALTARRAEAERRSDYLKHVAREIEEAKLVEGEQAKLDDEARRLTHVEDLRVHVSHLRDALDAGEQPALRQLASARKALAAAQRLDPSLARLEESLDAAMVSLEELGRDLALYDAALESDPERLAAIDRRRDVIHRVTRKHGGSVASALAALAEARAELDVLDTAELDLRGLAERAEAARRELVTAATTLTRLRSTGARRLSADVEALLPALGLPDGRFNIELTPRPSIGATGAEDAEFRVSLNVGHDARALSRVASGGELSRVMLALKTILARLDLIPTLVFDEVDSGIGGTVALQVGDALRALSGHHQVFVITHLAQIAARAHHHIVVAKGAREGVTTADISVVTGDDRVAEVARMLGGDPESRVSRAHARELLEAAVPSNMERPARRTAQATRRRSA